MKRVHKLENFLLPISTAAENRVLGASKLACEKTRENGTVHSFAINSTSKTFIPESTFYDYIGEW